MPKPLTTPTWNTGGANRVTPSGGAQATGYIVNEIPTSGVFNWFLFWIFSWLGWLNGLFGSDGSFAPEVNGHVTVSGTGRFKHPVRELYLNWTKFVPSDAATMQYSQLGYCNSVSAVAYAMASVELEVGKRITGATVWYNPNGGGMMTPRLRYIDIATGVITNVWSGAGDSTGTAIESQNSGGLAHVVAAGRSYFVECFMTAAANRLHGALVTFDDP